MSFDPRTHASTHLAWAELACHDAIRTPYPLDLRETVGRQLGREFERIRALVGKPIRVTSAYRTAAHNKAVGGKPRSQHLRGRALDLECPHGLSFQTFAFAVEQSARDPQSAIRYICEYPTHGFIHIDIREADALKVETV